MRTWENHQAIGRAFEALSQPYPYALLRVNGQEVALTKAQFEQAVRDGRLCKCGACLCCRAVQYERNRRSAA